MKTPTTVGGFEIASYDVTKIAQEIYDLWSKGEKRNFSLLWKAMNEPYVAKGTSAKVYFYPDGLYIVCPDRIGEYYDYLGDAFVRADFMLRNILIDREYSDIISVKRKNEMIGLFALRDGEPVDALVGFGWSGGNIHIRTYSVSMIELEVVLDFVQRVSVFDPNQTKE